MENQQAVPMSVDPNMYALTGANIGFDEEQFVFSLTAGNQIRGFMLTPKHAKRFSMLLQNQIENYEKQFGALNTELPKPAEGVNPTTHQLGFQVNNPNNQ